ncbi:MAG: UDP-N-acetylmuramoylalanyl-D-glutamyl-2,6-diaminopimelate--D-alanyl-D-alanine ligase [Rhodospirillaceae bacterium]|nr:MAG: UDP-N-acetylmuramoylalanyl-D-glutamyl-2,6-diaminopimelate--D-alanyl-D-alanine ligase [Rhodospirillaceae bacterium]
MTTPALWTAAEVANATGGTCRGSWSATGVSIDTRTLKVGDLFVALRGPSFDGHEFVDAALTRGAAGALVHRTGVTSPERESDSDKSHNRLVVVKDTFAALQDLARAARTRCAATVVAVTGSVGKTGTKELLKVALSAQGETSATEGNLNNHWGVPLSLTRLPRGARYGVFELGMNHAGEIAPLSRLVQPHVAVITAVEAVHLEFFATVEDIADEKAAIMDGLVPGGTAILPRDSGSYDRLAAAAARRGCRVVSFGSHGADALLVNWSLTTSGTQVAADIGGHRHTYEMGVAGRHWALNSVAVLAAVQAVGADVAKAAAAFARLTAPAGRGAHLRVAGPTGPFTVIDESYNASPASVRALAETVGAMEFAQDEAPSDENKGRRILVLGDMLEMGPTAPAIHADLAAALRANRIDLVFTAGPLMEHLHNALPRDMRGGHARDSAALIPRVTQAIRANDVVAVKGSHGSRMAVVVAALAALDASSAPRAANGH